MLRAGCFEGIWLNYPCSVSPAQVIAESYGFADLGDDVSAALAADLEYRIRELTQVSRTVS